MSQENNSININNRTSLTYNEKDLQLLQLVNYYIYDLLGSIIFSFGIIFNVLSFTYFQLSRSFKNTSMRYYFSVISITDSLHLIEWPILMLIDKKVISLSLSLCRFLVFVTTVNGLISIWLLVVLSIERYIILKYPFRGKVFYKIKTSIKILAIIISIITILNIPILVPNVIRSTNSNFELSLYMCNVNPKYHIYMFFNNLLFYSFIPFIILFIFNALLICLLSQQKKLAQRLFVLPNLSQGNTKQGNRVQEKTVFLVLVSFFLILTLSPRYLVQILLFFDIIKISLGVLSVTKCLIVLEMFNFSFNFFFYILCSKTSRYEFYLIFYYFFYWKWSKKSKVCFCNNCTSQLYQQQKQNTQDRRLLKQFNNNNNNNNTNYSTRSSRSSNYRGTFSSINSQYQYLCRLSQQANNNNLNSSTNKLSNNKYDHSVYVTLDKNKQIKRQFESIHFNTSIQNSKIGSTNSLQRSHHLTSNETIKVKYNYDNNQYIFKTCINNDDDSLLTNQNHQNNGFNTMLSHQNTKPRLQTFLMRHSNLISRFPFQPPSHK
jgi:hypothetical protein